MPYPSKKFRQNPFTSLRVIRRTDRQTDRQTDRTKNITSFFSGGNYIKHVQKLGINYPEKNLWRGPGQDLGACAPLTSTQNRHCDRQTNKWDGQQVCSNTCLRSIDCIVTWRIITRNPKKFCEELHRYRSWQRITMPQSSHWLQWDAQHLPQNCPFTSMISIPLLTCFPDTPQILKFNTRVNIINRTHGGTAAFFLDTCMDKTEQI